MAIAGEICEDIFNRRDIGTINPTAVRFMVSEIIGDYRRLYKNIII